MSTRIIFTVTNDLVYDRRMIRIGESLAQSGYTVMLVGRRFKDSLPFENTYIQSYRFRLFFNKGKLFYLEYNIRLFFWLLFQRFDIVGGIDLDTILPCYWASILRGGKPCVYDAHELFTEVPEVIHRPAIQKLWLTVEAYAIKRLTYQYTVSESIAEEFYRRYEKRFEVIRNLPQFSAFSPSPSASPSVPVILYQGNLNEGRGLETAIQAMQYISQAELWIAGDGDLGKLLRQMVRELKLECKVKFLGFVQPKDLTAITQQAHIGLHILEAKGLSYQFSLANKFLDYIQAGVPQICTQFVEHQRINQEYEVAVLLEKPEVQPVANAIQLLLADTAFYTRLKNNCIQAAQVLNWEKEEVKLKAFYEKVSNN